MLNQKQILFSSKHMKKYNIATFLFTAEIFLISLLGTFVSDAQNFVRFSNKEGFNQNTINTIAQDRYGYLWFGTPNGLIKYDGYEFNTYTSQNKSDRNITSNYINHLFNDSNGVLWIGTHTGVNIYIPWLEKFYTVPLPVKLDISHIRSDNDNNIWFSGENKLYQCRLIDIENGVFELSENILKKHPNISSINEFSFTKEHQMLLATTTGIVKLDLT
ncbi:MAG: two-component regulator propeller domain-containing protein, partial [Pseudomonadota bacterium]